LYGSDSAWRCCCRGLFATITSTTTTSA
jgi:hypothetical protein